MDEQKWLDERKQIGRALGLGGYEAVAKNNVAPVAIILEAIEKLQSEHNKGLANEVTKLAEQLLGNTNLHFSSDTLLKCLEIAGRLVGAKMLHTSLNALITATEEGT